MREVTPNIHPAAIPEWDAEDMLTGRLSGDTVFASEAEAEAMLKAINLGLPEAITQTELLGYAAHRATPLSLDIPADSAQYDFYLAEIPLSLLVPDEQRLVRLRLRLSLQAENSGGSPPVAYDLFPTDQVDDVAHSVGEVSLDVSKALTFLHGTSLAPLADAFGLKLETPLKWTSKHVRVRTTNRMSNPVEWYVKDEAIQNGFTGYLIVRVPRGQAITVRAEVSFELRKPGLLGRILKARYKSDVQSYPLQSDVS